MLLVAVRRRVIGFVITLSNLLSPSTLSMLETKHDTVTTQDHFAKLHHNGKVITLLGETQFPFGRKTKKFSVRLPLTIDATLSAAVDSTKKTGTCLHEQKSCFGKYS
jgi:hypothetical protein